jgi:hypothetical protein
MDFVCSFWGALLWLLIGGISGWIINNLIYGSKITELKNSIMDRDSRLMAISRDQKSIMGAYESKNHSLKNEISHLERANTGFKIHNSDLRNTIDELRKSQEEQLSLLFEPLHREESEETQVVKSNDDNPIGKKLIVSEKNTATLKKSNRKLKNSKKKLKVATKQNARLVTKIKKLKLILKNGLKIKTILKEVPVVIREEVQIKESIDKKKLEKLFSFKVPIIKSRKTLQVSKKKGKPTIVEK